MHPDTMGVEGCDGSEGLSATNAVALLAVVHSVTVGAVRMSRSRIASHSAELRSPIGFPSAGISRVTATDPRVSSNCSPRLKA
jgi:hypothetical protein